jgi:hypothetical protein
MPYYKDINLLFIHIPKTGGTSLEEYLKTKSEQSLFSIQNNGNTLFRKYNIHTSSLQHLTYKEIYKYRKLLHINLNKDLKIITIVRNPYERTISDLFFYNLINETTNKNDVYEILKKFLFSSNYDSHNKPQYKFLLDNNNKIIKNITIVRSENLTSDLKNYGFSDFDSTFKYNTNNKCDKKNYYDFLNKNSIFLINNFFKKDFKLFNYKVITDRATLQIMRLKNNKILL